MIPVGAYKHQMRPFVRRISLSRVSANLPMASSDIDIDSSINTMDRILSILQDAQVNNTSSIISTNVDSLLKPRNMTDLGHDLFNYKTIDVLLQLHTQKNVDVFQDSNPDRVKDDLESYIHIFKTRFVRQRMQHQTDDNPVNPSGELAENARALIFSQIAEQYEESPLRIFSIIGSFIRKEARDALRAIHATEPSWGNFNFGNIKLYQPFRRDTPDPFAIRLGLSTKHFPTNILSCMIKDHEILENFLKNAGFSSSLSAKSLQTLMGAQAIAGELVFKILFQKHTSNPAQELPHFFETMGLEKLKAIIASRSALLNRLDWYLPYRHSLMGLDDSILESEDKIVSAMADLFDRFFGVCFKSDSRYCDQWTHKLIDFCVSNHGEQKFFDDLLKESITSFKEKTVSSSFDAMSAKWKEHDSLKRSDEKSKRRTKHPKSLRKEIATDKFEAARELISNARDVTS